MTVFVDRALESFRIRMDFIRKSGLIHFEIHMGRFAMSLRHANIWHEKGGRTPQRDWVLYHTINMPLALLEFKKNHF